jgi:hypothetical protein
MAPDEGRAGAVDDEVSGATARAGNGLDLSRREAILLLRYVPAKVMLSRVRPFFYVKWAFVIAVVVGVVLDGPQWVVALSVSLFMAAYLAQVGAVRTIRRLGALDRLAALDEVVDDAIETWWPRLRAELARLDASTRPWGLLQIAARMAVRRRRGESGLPEAIAWDTIIPVDQLDRARLALAQA